MLLAAPGVTASPISAGITQGIQRQFTRVLLVDGNLDSAPLTRRILEQRGLEVRWARDGGQAHQMLPMYKPECVLSEIILPGESGFELCEWMKLWNKNLPVIVYSEIDLHSAHQLAQRLGADAYIDKPVSPATLFRALDDVSETVWDRTHQANPPEEVNGTIKFYCQCGAKLRKEISHSGRFVTCPQCHERVIVPRLGTHDMLCVGSESTLLERNEQEQFWRVTMHYVTVKCQSCSTFFRLFTSDRSQCTICPKCEKLQSGALRTGGVPLTEAALTNSLRVLQVFSGKHHGKRIMLPRHEILVGSATDCEIRRRSCGWNPHHCSLRPSVRGVLVRDLNRFPDTRINGFLIRKETILHPGDYLTIGRVWFRLLKPNCQPSEETKLSNGVTDAMPMAQRLQTTIRGTGTVFEFQNTASAAADVIQEYWETCRQRALRQLLTNPPPVVRASRSAHAPTHVLN